MNRTCCLHLTNRRSPVSSSPTEMITFHSLPHCLSIIFSHHRYGIIWSPLSWFRLFQTDCTVDLHLFLSTARRHAASLALHSDSFILVDIRFLSWSRLIFTIHLRGVFDHALMKSSLQRFFLCLHVFQSHASLDCNLRFTLMNYTLPCTTLDLKHTSYYTMARWRCSCARQRGDRHPTMMILLCHSVDRRLLCSHGRACFGQ